MLLLRREGLLLVGFSGAGDPDAVCASQHARQHRFRAGWPRRFRGMRHWEGCSFR
jgi:hypothetical protein